MLNKPSFSINLSKHIGFTLVELICVMLLVGIIAVIAVPRYINQVANAKLNSLTSLAGALSAVSADNYAKRSANSAQGIAIANCTTIANLLQGNALPSGYTINSQAIAANANQTCVLTGPTNTLSNTANFTGLGIS